MIVLVVVGVLIVIAIAIAMQKQQSQLNPILALCVFGCLGRFLINFYLISGRGLARKIQWAKYNIYI